MNSSTLSPFLVGKDSIFEDSVAYRIDGLFQNARPLIQNCLKLNSDMKNFTYGLSLLDLHAKTFVMNFVMNLVPITYQGM